MFNDVFINYIKTYIEDVVLKTERKSNVNEDLLLFNDKKIFNSDITKFIEVFTNSFPISDQVNFKEAFKRLNVKQTNIPWVGGEYDCKTNKMLINENYVKSYIFHELFHVASSYSQDNVYYSGFSRVSKFTSLGDGINEGYTELLAHRYFKDAFVIDDTYYFLVIVADVLEKIVGRGKMEHYYLQGSLKDLIKEMLKFSSMKDITKFLLSSDYVCKYMFNSKLDINVEEKFENSIKVIVEYLIYSYYKQLTNDINEGLIDEYCAKKNLMEVLNILLKEHRIGEHAIDISEYSSFDLEYLVEKVFSNQKLFLFITNLHKEYRR